MGLELSLPLASLAAGLLLRRRWAVLLSFAVAALLFARPFFGTDLGELWQLGSLTIVINSLGSAAIGVAVGHKLAGKRTNESRTRGLVELVAGLGMTTTGLVGTWVLLESSLTLAPAAALILLGIRELLIFLRIFRDGDTFRSLGAYRGNMIVRIVAGIATLAFGVLGMWYGFGALQSGSPAGLAFFLGGLFMVWMASREGILFIQDRAARVH